MREYIKALETIKQQYESALDDGRNSTDIDAIEAVEDNALAIEALNMATQALIDFPAMLKQYLGENDQMIIGKDVYEELKYELETLKKTAEPQEWIPVKEHGNPKESDVYWVTVTETPFGRNLVFAYAYDVNSKKWANGHIGNEKVIAWMKRNVPSPYKGE